MADVAAPGCGNRGISLTAKRLRSYLSCHRNHNMTCPANVGTSTADTGGRMCDRAMVFTRSVAMLSALAVVTVMATSIAAQSTTGTILGKVTDSAGLVLPGATITVTNTET